MLSTDFSPTALSRGVERLQRRLPAAALPRRFLGALLERRVATVLLALGLVLWFELQLLVYHLSSADAFRWLFTVESVAPTSPGWLLSVVSHATWGHLAVNVAMLLVFGGLAEPHLGRREYASFFIVVGAASTLGAVALRPPNAPLVGSSGAVFGFIGFSLYHLARNHDRDVFVGRDRSRGALADEFAVLRIATVGVVFPVAILQVALGMAGAVPTGNTAVRTHAFGFLLGVLYEYWRPLVTGRRCG